MSMEIYLANILFEEKGAFSLSKYGFVGGDINMLVFEQISMNMEIFHFNIPFTEFPP